MRISVIALVHPADSLFEYRQTLIGTHIQAYVPLNRYVGGQDQWKKELARITYDEAIGGSAAILLRILELHEPDECETSRLDRILKYLSELSDGTSAKLTHLTAWAAADLFDVFLYRGNHEAIEYLANALVKNASSEAGLKSIQAIIAPKQAPEGSRETCLYPALRKVIERDHDFKEWFEAHIPKGQRLRAYKASGYEEARSTSSTRQRGKMIEIDLGI